MESLVYQHSLFATTCELAGVAVPETVEFLSLVGLMRGRGAGAQDAIFCRYLDYQRAVRTAEHRLIVYPRVGMTQLFDLQCDPWENRKPGGETGIRSLKAQLLERLHVFQKDLGDESTPV